MAEVAWEYPYFIAAPVSTVYAHLAVPENYMGLSPLIVSISDIHYSTSSTGLPVYRYESIERFYFLRVIRYDNHLHVTMTLTQKDHELVSEVISDFRVRVRFQFRLEPENGGTRVIETITTRSPGLARDFVVAEAKRVQEFRARTLTARLEAAPRVSPS